MFGKFFKKSDKQPKPTTQAELDYLSLLNDGEDVDWINHPDLDNYPDPTKTKKRVDVHSIDTSR
jgi:hypothetical protein